MVYNLCFCIFCFLLSLVIALFRLSVTQFSAIYPPLSCSLRFILLIIFPFHFSSFSLFSRIQYMWWSMEGPWKGFFLLYIYSYLYFLGSPWRGEKERTSPPIQEPCDWSRISFHCLKDKWTSHDKHLIGSWLTSTFFLNVLDIIPYILRAGWATNTYGENLSLCSVRVILCSMPFWFLSSASISACKTSLI